MSSRSCRLWSQATFQVAGRSSSRGFESGFHVLSFLAQFWVFACSPSPHPRTHLHSHTLIPMCTSTRSHNSHTHLYMLMHTHAYTHSFTHTYMHVHRWPHNSSFHGALALWEAWWVLVLRKSIFIQELGAGKEVCVVYKEGKYRQWSPFQYIIYTSQGAAVKWFPPASFHHSCNKHYVSILHSKCLQRCHFWKTAQGETICSPTLLPEPQTYFWGC